MSEQLRQLIRAAESRGDMETAKAAMAKLRDASSTPLAPQQAARSGGFDLSTAKPENTASSPVEREKPTQTLRFTPGAMPGLSPVELRSPQRATAMTRELPELQSSGLLSGEDKAKTAAISPTILATTNPDEIAQIVTSQFPNVAVTYDKDAQGDVFPILTNRKTGARAIVNKPGLSGMDVLQTLGLGAAFTPAGRAASVVGAAGKAALTQGAIEGAQAAQGGDINPEDVAIAAAGGAAGQKLAAAFNPRINPQFIDPETQLPTKEFQSALKARNMDAGALVDDIDAGTLPEPKAGESPKQYLDRTLIDKLEKGESTSALFNLKIENGQLKKNPLGDEALKQGFQKGDIASINTADPATKDAMRKMARLKRAIQSNSAVALDRRPTDIVGDEAMKRVNLVRGRANGLRKELNSIAQQNLKGKSIETEEVANTFLRSLDDLNIEFTPGQPINYADSLVSEDKSAQRVIDSVSRLLSRGDSPDALDAHNTKRQLDNMIDFQRKEYGLTDAGNRIAKQVRASINNAVRDSSPEYAAVNDQLSMSIGALESFGDALGKTTDLYSEQAAKGVGQKLRRLLSNAESRANLDASLADVESAALELGGEFRTDLKRLVNFNKTLDDRFGATAKGSFQGEIESAARSGPLAAAKNFAARKGIEKVDELRGISETGAFNVLEEMLRLK